MAQTPVGVGERAPDFTLRDQYGTPTTLSSFRGDRNVVLVFFPFAFSGICTGELNEVRDDLGSFASADVQVLAVSCDSAFAHRAWADVEGYFFPLLSDFWPHGAVARAFGVFDEDHGMALRGTFLLDRDGVVRWTLVNEPGKRRDFTAYREALREITG